MKRIYWRPHKTSKAAVLAVGMTAIAAVLLVEQGPAFTLTGDAQQEQMLRASRLAKTSFDVIRGERLALGHEFPKRLDPGQTGMVGLAMSPLTSLPANLAAKQTSVNPNFAAAIVDMLAPLELKPGDCVAVGCTGSFPALNVCLCAALETIGCEPIVVHSVASSQFGANHPEMTWLDMESLLHEEKLITFRTSAATLGAFGDRAVGMSAESKQALRAAIERNGVESLEINSLAQSMKSRMQLYDSIAGERPIKAYINVGGGAASIHGDQGKEIYDAGATLSAGELIEGEAVDCVMTRFAARGVPIVHVGDTIKLATQYGLPVAPQMAVEVNPDLRPRAEPNRYAAGAVLMVVLLALRACVRTGGYERVKRRVRAWLSRGSRPANVPETALTPAVQLMV